MRETTMNVDIEVNGKEEKFLIKKMNVFDGSYLLKLVTEKVLPLLGKITNNENEFSLGDVARILPEVLSSLDDKEMEKLIRMCLKTCSMLLPAGYQEVIDAYGNFGIDDLEYDIGVCLRLVYEVIVFNVTGFFEGSGLGSLLVSRTGSQPMPKTSMK